MKIITFSVFKSLSEKARSYSYVETTAIMRMNRSKSISPMVTGFKNTPSKTGISKKYLHRKKPTVTITMPIPVIVLFNIINYPLCIYRKLTNRQKFTRRRNVFYGAKTIRKLFQARLCENRAIKRR